jgi:hypothetical protein
LIYSPKLHLASKQYRSCNSSLCSLFHPPPLSPVNSFLLGPDVSLSALFSNTLST